MEENPVTPEATPAAAASSTPPWANPQVRVAAVVIALIAVGVVLWFVFGQSKKHAAGGQGKVYKVIGPEFLSKAGLKAEAKKLGVPFYWAGPLPGFRYEFFRNDQGHLFVRYLPQGTPFGAKGTKWTVVVTYPLIGGYYALKKQAKKTGAQTLRGPRGSIIYPDKSDPRSVYLGFRTNPQFQVVVYNPSPSQAATIATSGQIAPVTG